jgi:hypothetical protein
MGSRSLCVAVCLAGAAALLAARAQALDVITFSAPSGDVAKDQVVSVTVGFSFDDLTVGGGFDLNFNPGVFAFQDFTFDSGLGDDPAFRMQPAFGATSGPFTIAFGSFSELTGTKTVGVLELIAQKALVLGAGGVLLGAADNVIPAGPFVDGLGSPLAVQYHGLLGVPEPSALLLAIAGVATLLARRRGATE